jgi:hypothetical protein
MNVTAEDGWAALGALERLRPEYLAEVHETQIRANFTLSHLIAHGMDLLACEGLPGLAALSTASRKVISEGRRRFGRLPSFAV